MSKTKDGSSATSLTTRDEKDFTPQEVLRVTSLEQLKTISDPLRVKILESVATKAYTVKQVAGLLDKPSTKLYYHMAALETAGFVVVVETRIKSGIIEKYYRAAAESISVDRRLLNLKAGEEDEVFKMLQSSVLDSTIDELKQSHKAGLIRKSPKEDKDDALLLSKSLLSMSEKDAAKFVKKFKALVAEFDKPQKTGDLNYVCALVFFPKVVRSGTKPNKERRRG